MSVPPRDYNNLHVRRTALLAHPDGPDRASGHHAILSRANGGDREEDANSMKLRTWLRPGMLVKRWILMLFAGLVLTSLSLAMALAWIYRNYDFPSSTAR